VIRLVCDYHGTGGWACHGRGFADALARHAAVEIVDSSRPPPARAPSIAIAVGPMEEALRLDGGVRILYTAWETTRVPPRNIAWLQTVDEVWIPSPWGRLVLVDSGLDAARVRVVPEGVDPERFFPAATGARVEDARFRFLCVGKLEPRKGIADLVTAFGEEFRPDEPVELYLHCFNPYEPGRDLAAAVAALAPSVHAPIHVGPARSPAELLALYQSSDAFVLPTRGEGWGLPIVEAMACALPVIVTGHGAVVSYADDEVAYLIDVRAMIDVGETAGYPPGPLGQWAQPDRAHLRALMRHVFEHPDEARRRGAAARAAMQARWTWDHAARTALAHLQRYL
jgi:glycosyltransferase involved in cell wall biosynthesis